jgi:Domain of unknown function (DUF1911)/Domain of unknown function (DUF1910)
MTEAEFRAMRRQKYLTEQYFQLNKRAMATLSEASRSASQKTTGDKSRDSASEMMLFQDALNEMKLEYTAGSKVEELRLRYPSVLAALSEWHEAEHNYSQSLAAERGEDLRVDMTPLYFEELQFFQLALDVVSLGVLLGDGDAVRQIALWMNSARGTDLLFETLIAPAVPDPRDNTDFFHIEPYDPLIDAFYMAETPEESVAFMQKYLAGWYKSFEGVPWHNGHLKGTDEYMPYWGYWAFEAAAICLIHNIDDSSFRDHIVYPKDLADWARANNSLAHLKPGASSGPDEAASRLRCEGGKPCPRAGYWMTPARVDSRRYFEANETMPKVGGDYGITIWQWDEQQ